MIQLIVWLLALPARLRALWSTTPAPAAVVRPVEAPKEAEEEPAIEEREVEAAGGVTGEQLAARLGLSIEADGAGAWRWRRHDAVWGGAPAPYAVIEDAEARRSVWAVGLGVRMGLDTVRVAWSPDVERPAAPEQVFRKEQVPSPYGERAPWLVPQESVEVWREITGRAPVERPWHDVTSCVVFVLEVGSRWHVLGQEEAEASLGEARLVEDARLAWFYESYKAWAHTRKLDVGKLRVYETLEGQGAGRALLLPELDWDAARASGFAATPTRDALWVLEPAPGVAPEVARATLEALVDACYEAADWPLSRALLAFDEREVRLASGGPGEHHSEA
jgi:hypothetical protein